MTFKERLQVIELWKNKTGAREITDWMEVSEWAINTQGVRGPNPPTEAELLARDLAQAAGRWYEKDPQTGEEYRKLLCIPRAGSGTMGLWFDSDDNVPRKRMARLARAYLEDAVSRVSASLARLERWNRRNPDEEPVTIPTDLTFPVELYRHREDDEEERGRKSG